MTQEEFINGIAAIGRRESQARVELANQFIKENAKYKVGDIIADNMCVIKVTRVKGSVVHWSSAPEIYYIGQKLRKKDLAPFKYGGKDTIYEDRVVKVYKTAEDEKSNTTK